jgi:hypothetical protein
VDNHSQVGWYDVYVTKIDGSGNYAWARTWGGDGDGFETWWGDAGTGVTSDGSGNVYVTGYFDGQNADFDPGPGTDLHSSKGPSEDTFLVKLSSDGTYQWGLDWGSQNGDQDGDHAYDVVSDGTDSLYVTGYFTGTVDFDPGSGVEERVPVQHDAFLSKFDTNGIFKWVKTWGGSGYDNSYGIGIGNPDELCVTGYFGGTVDLDPGSGIDEHVSVGEEDVFLSKFNSAGELAWSKSWGGPEGNLYTPNVGRGVFIDDAGRIYVTGSFNGECDFDPGPDTDVRSPAYFDNAEAFLSTFPPDGSW